MNALTRQRLTAELVKNLTFTTDSSEKLTYLLHRIYNDSITHDSDL